MWKLRRPFVTIFLKLGKMKKTTGNRGRVSIGLRGEMLIPDSFISLPLNEQEEIEYQSWKMIMV